MDIITAAATGDLERVQAVVEGDAELVHATDQAGCTALFEAAYYGHVEVVEYLLDHGCVVNHPDNDRTTALHEACWSHNPRVVLLLLHGGGNVNAVNDEGRTPLSYAASVGDDDDQDRPPGFHAASDDGVMRVLLGHGGVDVDAVEGEGWTACHWVCREGHDGMLRQLLEAGADPTARNANGRTPLDLAREDGHPECARILQEWERAYLLQKVRRVGGAASATPANVPPAGLIGAGAGGSVVAHV